MKFSMFKKVLALCISLALLLSSFLFPVERLSHVEAATKTESEPPNLVRNGGFEEIDDVGMPEQWGTYTFTGSPQYSTDDTVFRSGERSARIKADTSSRGVFNQSIVLTEEQRGKHYRIEQWIKTEDFTGRAYFRIQVYDEDRNRIDYIESNKISRANDWTRAIIEVYLPEEAERIGWDTFFENGSGTVWFDDTYFYEDGAEPDPEPELDPDNLLRNGSFERVNASGMAENWNTYTFTGSPEYSVVDSVYRTGSRSAKIEADVTSRGVFTQGIQLSEDQRGKNYRLEQWVKTENFTGGAYFRIQVYDDSGNRINLVESNSVRDAVDWELVDVEVFIPKEAVRIGWDTFFENGSGTVWYDDIRFYEYIQVNEMELNEEEVRLNPGETVQLVATVVPENATEQDVVWQSSDETIASVDNGVVTAHTDGIAAITVTAHNGVKADSLILVGEISGIHVPDYEESVEQGGFVTGQIIATPDAGIDMTYKKLTDPDQGVVQVQEDGRWTYYADYSYTGLDRFHVVVQDAAGNMNVARVGIEVLPVYHAPELRTVIQPTDKNTPVNGEMIVLQPNGEMLTFEMEESPAHGQATIDASNGKWTYTPNTDYVGEDSFTVRAANEHGKSAVTMVRLYTAPTADEIIAELKTSNQDYRHPRLIATEDDFDRMRSLLANNDENLVKWFAGVRATADSYLDLPPNPYNKPDGLRLSTASAGRISTLAFVYQITGDPVYGERAWEELEYVASDAYPDWSPGHFLDTATMTHGIALGYDWLYDYLSEEQRAVVRQAIARKGLTPAVPMYLDKTSTWVYNRDNWNFVSNAGMTMGALAIADEDEELAGLILREAFKSIQYGLPQYAPDGSAIEGPAYWEYGTMYLVYFLSSLETSIGHDFGFSDREGIEDTPLYPIHVSGPNGTFNYSDNNDAFIPGRLLLWFAERYNKPEYTWYHQFVDGRTVTPGMYDMIWYRPETYGADEPAQLDQEFEVPKAVTMRSNWSDPNALFVGFKGGVNGAPHGDLDTGSFVFDAHGVRWALDLGAEDYNLPGYWTMTETGLRWSYYRKRAEGHNTIVIQPNASTGPDQDVTAVSDIVRTEFERPEGSFAIADLTPAYKESAASVKRGTALIDHRRQFLVQDEIKLKEPSELYWFMHTRAQIELDEAGTTAWLSQEGRKLAVQIISPADASFRVMEAEALPSSPNPSGQTRNIGVRKLAIHLEDQLDTTIAVRMVPVVANEAIPPAVQNVVPLDEWQIDAGTLAKLGNIKIDGETVTDFDPDRYVYDVIVPEEQQQVPVVTAEAANGYDVTVHPAKQLPGTTRIEITDPDNESQAAVYYIIFSYPAVTEIPDDALQYEPVEVTASTHDGNIPENTLDGDFTTRWSAEGEQWIQYDLGAVRDLSTVAIAWYQGNVRQTYFNLQLSEDGEQWQSVFEGFSSGEKTDFEFTIFEETPAQYVRIIGYGNTQNQWNSIAEVMIFGPSEDVEPTPVTTASILELIHDFAEGGAFANHQVVRVLTVHLTAVQVFEKQENGAKVIQHMGGYHQLLDHWQESMNEQAYQALKDEADALIATWE